MPFGLVNAPSHLWQADGEGAASDRLDGVLGLPGRHLGFRPAFCFDSGAVGTDRLREAESKKM